MAISDPVEVNLGANGFLRFATPDELRNWKTQEYNFWVWMQNASGGLLGNKLDGMRNFFGQLEGLLENWQRWLPGWHAAVRGELYSGMENCCLMSLMLNISVVWPHWIGLPASNHEGGG